MEDVTFSYVLGKPVLKHATITAHKGEQVAIVGPTRRGQNHHDLAADTLLRHRTAARSASDGTPIERDHSRFACAARVGMVLQDTYLFSETVRENIRYGRLDATDEEVEQAARMANAHSFIIHLPQGYDTVLADNAGNISQGQRQLHRHCARHSGRSRSADPGRAPLRPSIPAPRSRFRTRCSS